MEYDLEVNDLFEIISTISNPGTATNIIEDILDYKWKLIINKLLCIQVQIRWRLILNQKERGLFKAFEIIDI